MAIEFEDFVLAFPSKDFLFQATWARSRSSFKVFPEIHEDFHGFLEQLIQWMKRRIAGSSNRDMLAAEVIRAATEIWPGIGAYTINELFSLGGMHFILFYLSKHMRLVLIHHRQQFHWVSLKVNCSTRLIPPEWHGLSQAIKYGMIRSIEKFGMSLSLL
jgi:hypothetical protein